MAPLNERMKELFSKQGIFVLGTADKNGNPNVVPVGAIKLLDDETILISDQFFNKTLHNLKENPSVAISFWETEKGEGYQVKGVSIYEFETDPQGNCKSETWKWK